jgi:TetR/AcrR family transcriptional regulator, regulator of autoinduction and epiphytic fitness
VRIDPRIELSRQAILRAAVDELADRGYGRLTIEAVAARAKVGKATVYRQWSGKLELIADALETFHVQMVPSVEPQEPRLAIEHLVRHVAEVVLDSTFSRCIPALIDGAERDRRVRRFLYKYSTQRRKVMLDLIAGGIASGEFNGQIDPETAVTALLGSIFYSRLMTGSRVDPLDAPKLVASILGPAKATATRH